MPASDLDPTARRIVTKEIRQRVTLSIGPNSRDILDAGGAVHLTPGEANDAADAAFAALERFGYTVVPAADRQHTGGIPGWVRNLKVDVTDEHAADTITAAGMVAYLRARSWVKVTECLGGAGEFWRHPDQPATHHNLVPLAEDYEDFRRRVIDLARQIAALEHRGLIGVLEDLRVASEPAPAAEALPGQEAIDV